VTSKHFKVLSAAIFTRKLIDMSDFSHISQVSNVFVRDISSVLSAGERIRCVVIKVDMADGSVNLSTKMLEERAGDLLKDKASVFERATNINAIALDETAGA